MSSAPVRAAAIGTLLIAAGYGSAFLPGGAPRLAPWAMLTGNIVLLVALLLLGARRSGAPLRPLVLPLLGLGGILLGGFGAALLLPPEPPSAPFWLGLPRRAALVIYGVGLLPAAILPLVYARSFDSITLRPEDLERIRAARDRRERSS